MPAAGEEPAESLVRGHGTAPAVVFFSDEAGSPKEGRHPLRICGGYCGTETCKKIFEVVPRDGEARVELHVLSGCCEYPGCCFRPWRRDDGGHLS